MGLWSLVCTMAREIAPARTFGFKADAEALHARGLARGASLENTVVLDENGVMNDGLRFPDEFVRHKILDLIGDLSLIGMPVKGHVISLKSGHHPNVQFVRRIAALEAGSRRIYRPKKPQYWDIRTIMDILPHRYPFLMIDRIIELEEKKRIVVGVNDFVDEELRETATAQAASASARMPGEARRRAAREVVGVLQGQTPISPVNRISL